MLEINQIPQQLLSLGVMTAPFIAAFVIAIALPIILISINNNTQHIQNHTKLTILFASIAIGSALAIALSGRVMTNESDAAQGVDYLKSFANEDPNSWPSRIAHFVLLSIAMSEIFSWAIRKKKINDKVFSIWLVAINYWFFSVVASGIFGELREYSIKLLYAPIVFTATAILIDDNYPKFLNNLRHILFPILAGSLLLSILEPSLVMETGYKSLIPGFNIRLAGLTEHANSLGVLAAISLLLETRKTQSDITRLIYMATSASCLILSQSKTAWGITIVGLLFYLINKNGDDKSTKEKKFSLGLILAMVAALLLISTVASFKFESIIGFLQDDRTGLTSFTGRTKIWDITISEFVQNPLFGYGPALWDSFYRYQKGMLHVGQAHNQYIQTLGQAGIIGSLALAIYIMVLCRASLKGPHFLYGMPIVFTLALLIRGFSESPMRMMGILDTDGLVHLLAFLGAAASAFTYNNKRSTPKVDQP